MYKIGKGVHVVAVMATSDSDSSYVTVERVPRQPQMPEEERDGLIREIAQLRASLEK